MSSTGFGAIYKLLCCVNKKQLFVMLQNQIKAEEGEEVSTVSA